MPAQQKSTGQPVIVYIHGIGRQKRKPELKKAWDLALFGQDMGARTRMAYWADLLHGDDEVRSLSARSQKDENRDLKAVELLRDAKLDAEDTAARQFVEAVSVRLASAGATGKLSSPSKRVLPLPGFLRRPIARRFLKSFVPDAAAYFFRRGMRKKIQQRFLDELPSGDTPFIVVAHSLGSVISLEVLAKMRTNKKRVPLFVTMGSPLGIEEIQDFLKAEKRIPSVVSSWDNFADRLDPVAIDGTLSNDFEPRGTIEDCTIINERTKELLRFNPHSSIGYLAHPRVRASVHESISFDSMGRFLVARDVAEGFAAPDERQPILIEALEPGYHAIHESPDSDSRRNRDKEYPTLPERIHMIAEALRERMRSADVDPVEEGRVDELRRFVAAHLTEEDVVWLAEQHADFAVYSVWRSAEKSKLLHRSAAPLKVDAARNSYSAYGDGISWAVLDTGTRFDHPHFSPDIAQVVYDCTRPGPPQRITDPALSDVDGHGTHVSGIIAGWETDDDGEPAEHLGIAPHATLYVYKVLDDSGRGEDAWIIKAIDHIAATNESASTLRIHGANLSLGGPYDATVYGCGHSPICQELRGIWRNGVVVCVAAGNEGQVQVETADGGFDLNTQLSIGDPANLEECIAVGSVNPTKPYTYGISYFSSRGPTSDGRAKPDVVAPGERIHSCDTDFDKSGQNYRSDSGTSMACPHVSGLIAAFLSVRREFIGRPDEVKRILMENANDLKRDRYHQGAGIPNLMRMLLNT